MISALLITKKTDRQVKTTNDTFLVLSFTQNDITRIVK